MPRSLAAGCRSRAEHDGAGAVAEEDAGGAVGPVEDAREGLGADDERASAWPALISASAVARA